MTATSDQNLFEATILQTGEAHSGPLAIGIVFGVTLTFLLFFLMQSLASFNDEVDLRDAPLLRFVDVIEDIPDEIPAIKDRTIEKPDDVVPPPETPDVDLSNEINPDANLLGISNAVPKADLGNTFSLTGLNMGPSEDGDYLPLVRVQPQYPTRAAMRKIEGKALVELTVSADGTVPYDSIRVIQAEPKGYFEKAAIQAASKFKYKPKVVNGEPQAVSGVRYLFIFELAKLHQQASR